MAEVPYSGGVPEVQPEARPPDDLQRIQANPNQFGALIGQGEERLGQGAVAAGNFFGEVQTDDASKNAMQKMNDATNRLWRLEGSDRLRAIPEVQKEIEDAYNEGKEGLNTPRQQHQYDESVRNFQMRYIDGQVSRLGAQASRFYANNTNNSAANFHLGLIAQNPFDDQVFNDNLAEVNLARGKNADLAGVGLDGKRQIIAGSIAEANATRVRAMSASNPVAAFNYAQAHRKELSVVDGRTGVTYYDSIVHQLQAQKERINGHDAGDEAFKGTYQAVPPSEGVVPVLNNIGEKYGVSGSYLERTWQIESGGRLNPPSSSTGAQGPFQFTGKTAASVGLANPHDFRQSAEAAAKLAADNKVVLAEAIGHEPTDAELYLAHQQGAQGASLLLMHPNVRAGDLVGAKAIAVNGGDPNAPASAFTSMWTARYNGSAAVMSQARKAAAYQNIISNPGLNDNEKAYALRRVNQIAASQQIAMEADYNAKRLANETAANEWVTKIITGQPFDINQMANDPRLLGPSKENLYNFATQKMGVDDPIQYGPKYTDVYRRMFLPANDPSRITDINQILAMGQQGGGLTTRGVDRLTKIFTESRNAKLGEHDPNALHQVQSSLLAYAKSKMAREQIVPGIGRMYVNQKGEQKFDSEFVPLFEARVEQWTKAGKDPYELLTKANIDKMMDEVYPKSQRDADSIQGMSQQPQAQLANGAPLPAPPQDVKNINADNWNYVVSRPPMLQSGQRMSPAQWSEAIGVLLKDPSAKVMAAFNRHFGVPGYQAADILKQLGVKVQ